MSMPLQLIRELGVLQLQATMVLGVLLVLVASMRHTSPRVRHTMLGFGLFGLLLLPLQFVLPMQWIPIDPAWVPVDVAPVIAGPDASFSAAASGDVTMEPSRFGWDLAVVLALIVAAVWGLGAAFFAARASWLWLGEQSLVRGSTAVDARMLDIHARLCRDCVGRAPRLLASNRIDAPIVFGVLRSTILVPTGASSWCDDRIEAVLRHELAHAQQRDPLWLRLGDLGLALFWVHPLYWLALARLRLEAEHAADDAVLGSGMRASSYATVLLDLTRALPARPRAAWATGASRPSQLRRRIVHILAQRTRSLPRLRQIVPVALGSLGAALCSAVLYLERSPEDPRSSRELDHPIAMPRGHVGPGVTMAAPTGDLVIELRRDRFRLRSQRTGAMFELPMSDGSFRPEDVRNHLIVDAAQALGDSAREADVAVYWVDAAVPFASVVNVAYTLGRVGLRDHRFVFATQLGPRGLDVRPPLFSPDEEARARVVRIEWVAGSPVERSEGTSTGCEVVLTLQPEPQTTYGEFIAVATQERPTDACLGGVIIEAGA